MSDEFSKVEVITGVARRRRFSTEQKLAIVAETMRPGQSSAMLPVSTGSRPA
jgi:transposase